MDTLRALSLFNKAVETGSFSEAGRQEGLAPSSVSRRIGELERWVGAALFHRTTRKLNLTEVGRRFHDHTRGVLADLEEARVVAARLEDRPSGLVRMTVPDSLERHVTAALAAYRRSHPEVSFALTFTDRLVDLVGEGFDLAIRLGRLGDSTLRRRAIGQARRFLCAAPGYLERAGTPTRPEQLADHDCLIFRSQAGYNVWRFRVGRRTVDVRAAGAFAANSGPALTNAARDGLGLVLAPEWLVGPALASGDLVQVLADFPPVPDRTQLSALHPYPRFVPPKVRTLVDFLATRFGGRYDWRVRPGSGPGMP